MNKKIENINIENMGTIKFEKLKSKNKKKIGNPIYKNSFYKKVTRKEISDLIDNEYIEKILPIREKNKIYYANARNLISPYRFDVIIKLMYIEAYIKNKNMDATRKLYLEHIRVFNNFNEPDGKKKSAKDFIEQFNKLICDVKKNGVKTIIPISNSGEIIDGSHRLAIAIYFNMNIPYAIFDVLDPNFNYEFFKNRGLDTYYLHMVLDYLVKDENISLIIANENKLKNIENKLDVFYEEKVNNDKLFCLTGKTNIKKINNVSIYLNEEKKEVYNKIKNIIK